MATRMHEQPAPQLSPDDVAYLVQLHSGFVGIPTDLHAALCSKLINGVLDAGASFYIEENDKSRRQTHALVDLPVEGDVWICEIAASFSSREELLFLVGQEGDTTSDEVPPLHAVAGVAPGANVTSTTDALLNDHSYLLSAAAGGNGEMHFICDGFGGAFGAAELGSVPSCCSVPIFSPLHSRQFNVIWVATALKQNEACTAARDHGCYFANAKGGNAHLHRVSSPRYRDLFNLDRTLVERPIVADTKQLTNLSPDPLHPVLLCPDFLQPQELDYLRALVYDGEKGSFGTQFVSQGLAAKGNSTTNQPSGDMVANEQLQQELLDADTMALVAAALGERNRGGGGGTSGATKNRLRTSHFLRTVWWRSGQGRKVFETIAARAAALLGLPSASVEAPQMVCYPGGLSYFRPHHDSGRLLEKNEREGSSSEDKDSSSSDNEESSSDVSIKSSRPAWVNLDRDQHGAARVATAFVYLSSHEPGCGGATTFSHLHLPNHTTAQENAAMDKAAAAKALVVALNAALVAAQAANSTSTEAMLVAGTSKMICMLTTIFAQVNWFCCVRRLQRSRRQRQKLLAPPACLSSQLLPLRQRPLLHRHCEFLQSLVLWRCGLT